MAAFFAGRYPKITPISVEQVTASTIDITEKIIRMLSASIENTRPMPNERIIPSIPPKRHTRIASIRNCWRMSDFLAPTAILMPISLVLSVTETSMMFITPIPPTIREMTAMAETRSVMVPNVLEMVFTIVSELLVKTSFAPWRLVRKLTMDFSATALLIPSLTRRIIVER